MTKKLKSTIKYDPNTRSNSKSNVTLATCKTKKTFTFQTECLTTKYEPESKTTKFEHKTHFVCRENFLIVTRTCPLENKGKQVN